MNALDIKHVRLSNPGQSGFPLSVIRPNFIILIVMILNTFSTSDSSPFCHFIEGMASGLA